MCGTCPARANWYFQSTNLHTRDEWARIHLEKFGHACTLGHSETSFNPRSA
jgi:hypothetical protein